VTNHPRKIRPHATPRQPKQKPPVNYYLAHKARALAYNYDEIPEPHREAVQKAALDIRSRIKRTVEDMLEIGRQLNAVKALVPGKFDEWVASEFGMSRATASEFRNAADRFSQNVQNLYLLPVSVVRRLAAPSVPDEAVAAVIAEAQAQDRPLRFKDAMAIVKPYLPPRPRKPKQLPGPVAAEPDVFARGAEPIEAEYTVIAPAPGRVTLRRELLLKILDGAAHKVFMPFLSRDEHDELLNALTRALEE
jgi:hypothetical protein